MAVYITNSMLSRMSKVQLPTLTNPEFVTSGNGHWQKMFSDGNNSNIPLAKALICRVCGRDGCTPITEKINEVAISHAICLVTNVSIDPGDSLPKYICTSCIDKLSVAMEFKKTCQSSDKRFKQIINPMGDPAMHSYPYSKHDFHLILHEMKLAKQKLEEDKARLLLAKEQQKKKIVNEKEFKCGSCEMTFAGKEGLSEHRRDRRCMRRACDVCGQLVVSIRQHMRSIHKRVTSHPCPTCKKEFPILARLKNHMLVHSDTFHFFCDLCPYKSKHKYYLVMHMRTHTGEKPYKCPDCPATFVNPSNLNKHKLTHQEKRFKCMMCEKTFRTNGALREHLSATHMNIKHTCNYCGRDFCYRSDLRKHEIRTHNRTKRDYIGGEPSYKQVERLQKVQENTEIEKWQSHEIVVTQPAQMIQATYLDVDPNKSYGHSTQTMVYFTDGSTLIPHAMDQMVHQQTVEITLPELTLKKDDPKLNYEPQQTISFF